MSGGKMKGGRDVGKVMGPLFPRLHVNDADKGGPRAPPRNKMALCDHFAIPSGRFDHSSVSMSWLMPSNSHSIVPSDSNNQEKTMGFQYKLPPIQPPPSEELQATYCKGKSADISTLESVKSYPDSTRFRLSKDDGPEKLRMGYSSSSRNFSNVKSSCLKKTDDEDDYSVPTLEEDKSETQGLFHGNSTNGGAVASSSQPSHHSVAWKKSLGEALVASNCKKHGRDSENNSEENQTIKPIFGVGYREKTAEPVAGFMSRGKITATINVCEKQEIVSVMPVGGSTSRDKLDASNSDPAGSRIVDASRSRNEHPSNHKDCWNDVQVPQSQEIGELGNNGTDSGSSIMDSENGTGFGVSPDDTCKVIGQKNYWKTRQVLRNQQRVFTEQVFELHRLIKVQKLIAASPSVLLEGNSCLPKSIEASEKSLYPDSKLVPVWQQPKEIAMKDEPQKDIKDDYKTRSALGATPEAHLNKELACQTSENEHHNRDLSAVVTDIGNKQPIPWCFPHPNNQWLIPVMSPSEGLVYKPCIAPYPPGVGFMAPGFGGCGSFPMLPFPGGAFPFAIPSQQQQNGFLSNCFMSPHGPPIMNHAISQANAQGSTWILAPRREHSEEHSPSSVNSSDRESVAFLGNNQKLNAMRELDFTGITALGHNSGDKRSHCTSTRVEPHTLAEHPQVIKVIPHRSATASKSAARIFQSIKKERQLLHDLE